MKRLGLLEEQEAGDRFRVRRSFGLQPLFRNDVLACWVVRCGGHGCLTACLVTCARLRGEKGGREEGGHWPLAAMLLRC